MMRFGSPAVAAAALNGLIRPAGESSLFDAFAVFRLPDRASTGCSTLSLK
jgi:hypothetical protein